MSEGAVHAVDWWRVIVTIEKSGYTQAEIALEIGVSQQTINDWKNRGREPLYSNGARLITLFQRIAPQR